MAWMRTLPNPTRVLVGQPLGSNARACSIMIKHLRHLNFVALPVVSAFIWFTICVGNQVLSSNQTDVFAENGLIENTQACVLALACTVYFFTAVLEKQSERLILLFCALLCYSFVLREINVEEFDIAPALVFIGHGVGRNTTLALAFSSIAIYAALHLPHYKKAAFEFAKSKAGKLLIAGGVFLFVGQYFETSHSLSHHVFFEEIAELFGYVLILLSSIAAHDDLYNPA
ncbi:MAG: hypothetical protein ACRCV9_01715 [Burkholderiaceae bacterium]